MATTNKITEEQQEFWEKLIKKPASIPQYYKTIHHAADNIKIDKPVTSLRFMYIPF